ncbi:unnamed protein product [Nippostrongylus brasiliensis]|uniref:Nucleoporin ndc-1 (inferred by orthology to a C. elegans protein) n=1 Tax=Nippostrongylus brasiliensis TaxID=27835 RepID=A0A0N4YRA8_NIPBR|nr:unnamed protein product [Nippostrongylus brasiliensis]
MLGDYAHQSLLTGEVASSPLTSLSRRSTFDEDSFFSPSKPKSEQRTSRPVSSPQQVHKLPTVHDKVLRWFLDLIGLVHTISTMFAIGQESTLISTCRDAARVTVASGIFGSILGLFIHGWSSLLHVFNISFHTYTFVIVFGQLFAIKALLKLVCHIVMKPISFALPPPFVVHSPTPEQMRTLPVVLDSQNVLLKLFAFTDLRRIAWTDRSRRLEVFSLSQPGENGIS